MKTEFEAIGWGLAIGDLPALYLAQCAVRAMDDLYVTRSPPPLSPKNHSTRYCSFITLPHRSRSEQSQFASAIPDSNSFWWDLSTFHRDQGFFQNRTRWPLFSIFGP